MNKSELIQTLSDHSGQNKDAASDFLDALACVTKHMLQGGNEVLLPGIGKFSVVDRAARVGRHPQTGASITIPAKKTVKFKAAKTLSDAL